MKTISAQTSPNEIGALVNEQLATLARKDRASASALASSLGLDQQIFLHELWLLRIAAFQVVYDGLFGDLIAGLPVKLKALRALNLDDGVPPEERVTQERWNSRIAAYKEAARNPATSLEAIQHRFSEFCLAPKNVQVGKTGSQAWVETSDAVGSVFSRVLLLTPERMYLAVVCPKCGDKAVTVASETTQTKTEEASKWLSNVQQDTLRCAACGHTWQQAASA